MLINKKIIIISISSDFGCSIYSNYLKSNIIIGTYRRLNKNLLSISKNNNLFLKKVNLTKSNSIKNFCNYILKYHKDWTHIIFCNGDLNPIEKFTKVKFEKWKNSLQINFLSTINILNLILKHNKRKRKLLFFAGNGTNNAVEYYSSYTLSKILLIKFTELLDYEEKNIDVAILGPGWIKTKIHQSTLKSKIKKLKNKNFTKKIFRKNNKNDLNTLNLCIDWIFKNSSKISGRNISLKFDKWGYQSLLKRLKKDKNLYKLRRYGN
jgi:short-subunit dehydrogenase